MVGTGSLGRAKLRGYTPRRSTFAGLSQVFEAFGASRLLDNCSTLVDLQAAGGTTYPVQLAYNRVRNWPQGRSRT